MPPPPRPDGNRAEEDTDERRRDDESMAPEAERRHAVPLPRSPGETQPPARRSPKWFAQHSQNLL